MNNTKVISVNVERSTDPNQKGMYLVEVVIDTNTPPPFWKKLFNIEHPTQPPKTERYVGWYFSWYSLPSYDVPHFDMCMWLSNEVDKANIQGKIK